MSALGVPGISQPSVSAHGREEKKVNEARVPGCFVSEQSRARGRGTRLER